jgi:hypothetical protein
MMTQTIINGWNYRAQIERERAREFAAEQRKKTGRELDKKLRDVEVAKARIEGKLEAVLDGARRDPGLIEAVRIRAWAKLGKVDASYSSVAADPWKLTAPDGWPEGVSEDDAMAEVLAGLAPVDNDA